MRRLDVAPRGVPRQWDWILDDVRRRNGLDLQTFPGMRDYYAASDEHLVATRGRSIAGAGTEHVPRDRVAYEQALSDHFGDLLRAHRCDPSPIWSIDDVHADYIRGREEI